MFNEFVAFWDSFFCLVGIIIYNYYTADHDIAMALVILRSGIGNKTDLRADIEGLEPKVTMEM